MSQIRFLPTENFHGRLLPWVIGVMVFLSGLAIAVSMALQSTAQSWQSDLARQMTVQIVDQDPEARAEQAESALQLLMETPGVATASIAAEEEVEALLEPWLGEGNVTAELPLPTLIRVELLSDATLDSDVLGQSLAEVAPAARVDTHERWLSDLLLLARVMQWLGALIVGLVIVATISIIVFATRAGLSAQRETVEIVHTMGAQDALIAGAFQRRFLLVGLRGGLYGLGLLALVFLLVVLAVSGIESAYVPDLSSPPVSLAVILLLPLPAALIAMMTARYTVMRALAEMV